jgi:hypothetical protein
VREPHQRQSEKARIAHAVLSTATRTHRRAQLCCSRQSRLNRSLGRCQAELSLLPSPLTSNMSSRQVGRVVYKLRRLYVHTVCRSSHSTARPVFTLQLRCAQRRTVTQQRWLRGPTLSWLPCHSSSTPSLTNAQPYDECNGSLEPPLLDHPQRAEDSAAQQAAHGAQSTSGFQRRSRSCKL